MSTQPPGAAQAAPDPDAFRILSAPALVQFLIQGVQPPTRVYLARNDVLRLDVISLNFVFGARVVGRYLGTDGQIIPFEQDINTLVPGTLTTVRLNLAEGFLLSLAVTPNESSSGDAQMYAIAGFERSVTGGTAFFDVLVAGYAASQRPLAFPGFSSQRPTDGAGAVLDLVGAVPVAGADPTFTLPVWLRMRPQAIVATLTAAVAAANRVPRLALPVFGGFAFFGPNNTQLASQVVTYTWFSNAGPSSNIVDATAANLFQQAAMPEFTLPFLSTLRIFTDGIQAGDQWTALAIHGDAWFEPQ